MHVTVATRGGGLALRSLASHQPAALKARTQPNAPGGRGNVTRLAASGDSRVAMSASVAVETKTETDARVGSPSGRETSGADTSSPVVYVGDQVAHSLHERGREVFQDMTPWAEDELVPMLRSSTKCWQPNDYLPDSGSPEFIDQLAELQRNAKDLPLDFLVVLVGDMVTEEALPSYMNMLNLLDEAKDETGAQEHAWARWTRGWTSEENRHGDLLNKYLYASGRVDMRAVEVTIQNLIGAGLDPKLENNPYLCFVYTSFQERATKISHGNTARLAAEHGDDLLCKICGIIAADEARHEAAYTRIMEQVFERDPEGAVLAFADMMKKRIVMPAHLCDDGWHSEANGGRSLFADYATVAQNIGVYTADDYVNIVDHLVKRWNVQDLRLSGEAADAQEFLCEHPAKLRTLVEMNRMRAERAKKRSGAKASSPKTARFSWVSKDEELIL